MLMPELPYNPTRNADAAARAAAARLLGNVRVREAVDARLAAFAEETGMTAKEAWAESRWGAGQAEMLLNAVKCCCFLARRNNYDTGIISSEL
jgi:hypothetical protein